MLKPKHFGYNLETKFSNYFQNNLEEDALIVRSKAIEEFDSMVKTLKDHDINIQVFEDSIKKCPDAIFMNNWISVFPDGKLVIYPMQAKNRREERRRDIINEIIEKYDITEFIDLSHYEEEDLFLEGTGSVVFDHKNKLAFACNSTRTSEKVFNDLCDRIGYRGFFFNATDINGKQIYHTNVMMSILDKGVIICSNCIDNVLEKNMILTALKNTGRSIIELNFNQLSQYSANCLEVFNKSNQSKLIMSRTAFSGLNEVQLIKLNSITEIVPVNISIIERVGGGSARCMLTDINC